MQLSGNVSCQNIPGIATDGASSPGSGDRGWHAGASQGDDRVVVASRCHRTVPVTASRLGVWAAPCVSWPAAGVCGVDQRHVMGAPVPSATTAALSALMWVLGGEILLFSL